MSRPRSLSFPFRQLLALVLVVLVSVLAGCAAASGDVHHDDVGETPTRATDATTPPPAAEVMTGFVVVGDSITAGTERIDGNRIVGTGSWVPAAAAPPVTFLGGWAVPGSTSAAMLEGATPMTADVLVLMAGTNDLVGRIAWGTTRANLVAIVDRVGVRDVLLSAVPPIDARAPEVVEYNRQLEILAAESGWRFVDPWTDVWDAGSFVDGTSSDGVHPVQEYADRAGLVIRTELLDGAGG